MSVTVSKVGVVLCRASSEKTMDIHRITGPAFATSTAISLLLLLERRD